MVGIVEAHSLVEVSTSTIVHVVLSKERAGSKWYPVLKVWEQLQVMQNTYRWKPLGTAFPQIEARAFISFSHYFTPASKQDRR